MNKRFFLFLILMIGIFVRIFNLGKHSFWCDELLAISLGKHSIRWMIDYITFNDAHPPLFYAMVHFWLKLGKNEFILRILPLIFGIMCIPSSYFLGEKFKNEKTGLFLSLFISLSPPLILWSQIIKSYTLFTFLTILSFISFLNYIEKKEKIFLINLAIFNILLLYTHNLAFIVILIQILSLIILRKLDLTVLFSLLIILIFYFPWLLRIPYQIIFTLGVRRPVPIILRFPYTLFYFFLGETINPFNFKILVPIFLFYLFLIPFCLKSFWELNDEKKWILIISLFLPLILVFFPSTVPQNLIPFSIFYLLFYSLGLENLNKKSRFSLFFFLTLMPSLYFYYSNDPFQYQDASKLIPYKEIYEKIQKFEKEGDLIFTTENIDKNILAPIQWYYHGKNQIIEIENEEDFKKISDLAKNKTRFFLILDNINRFEVSERVKNFFKLNFEKIYEEKFIFNEKLLSKLKGKREYYYLVEMYIFKKKE
ncbi:MAG: glycosyltransferase family 39 protein [Candidatus Omnitrophica bacterium]|nr:glycosyltransferase family 39 protein [Candidatus Omnitrophota bacterium]